MIETIEVDAAKKGELIDGTRDMLVDLKNRNDQNGSCDQELSIGGFGGISRYPRPIAMPL